MKCTNCGAEFEDGTLFCPRCNKEVQWVPEYHSLETILRQKELMEQEKKKKELEAQKEKERQQRKAEQERRKKRKKAIVIGSSVAAVVAAAGLGIFFVYQTQHNSFDFQMAQAETEFSNKDYENAMKYVNQALSLKPDSAEANILQAKIYLKDGDENAALDILLSVTEEFPDSTSAYGELLRLYESKEEYLKIKELMDNASDTMRDTYKNYVCELPQISQSGGDYQDILELEFKNIPSDTQIYYTLDGKEPDFSSQKYTGSITLEEEGSTTFKYIAYNKKKIPSDVGKETYNITYQAPEKPMISPSDGQYEYQEQIIVTAAEGCDIYYSFDEEPTIHSEKYTGPIPMPSGEHTFSAIAVDRRGKISQVSSKMYVYYN